MTNILNKPYTNTQYAEFAHAANQTGKRLEQDDNFVYALCPGEKIENGEIVDNSAGYKAQIVAEQEAAFEAEFMQTTFGWLRKSPKGFSNLMESFNTAMIAAQGLGFVPEGAITTYQKPEFTGEDTQNEIEERLIDNAVKNAQMSAVEFAPMYLEVAQKWVSQEHS